MVGSETGEEEPHSDGQIHHEESHQYSVLVSSFSAYGAISVNSSAEFTDNQPLIGPTTSIVIHRPPVLRTDRPEAHNRCGQGDVYEPLDLRDANQIKAIVIHSTNNGNSTRDFNSELGWATGSCNGYFAHYYIDRNGVIYQVVDDLIRAEHTRPNNNLRIENTNSIGIELFLNVGEPYDGRQISALIRLVDHLMEVYALPRPERDPATGVVQRNLVDINQGGDRIVSHAEVRNEKCDPSGTFLDSGFIKPEQAGVLCDDSRVTPRSLSVGDSAAPALMDVLLDAIAVLDRDGQHTGIINTQGGDSFETGQAGHAGAVRFVEDTALVAGKLGTEPRTRWEENEPTLPYGPGPLILASGPTAHQLSGGTHAYTDIIIAGTLEIDGEVEFHVTGTFYVSPTGQIIVRNGNAGANLTVYSRGVPIIQGLIDTRGENGVDGAFDGGDGGNVTFYYSAPGLLLVPTIYARGGDSDTADVSLAGGGPAGGNGGDITLDTTATSSTVSSHLFLGGGVGPRIGDTRIPTWHTAPIDPDLLDERWGGDYLPPTPPLTLSSLGTPTPHIGQRVPKVWSFAQPGFTRGFLTAGGMGGVAIGGHETRRDGGPAGQGGNILITTLNSTPQGKDSRLTFRDIDIATGMEIETVTQRFYLSGDAGGVTRQACTASGAHGGFATNHGSRGGDGGPGGDAGSVTVTGATFNPPADSFADLYEIRGFPSGERLQEADSDCSRGRQLMGHAVEARSQAGDPLYRVRINTTRTKLLGGHGGIPRGSANATYTGDVGPHGATAPLAGLSVQ